MHDVFDAVMYIWPGRRVDSKEWGHTVLNIQKDLPNLKSNCEQILFLFNLFTQLIYATIA